MSDTQAVPAGGVLESFQKLTERPVIKQKTTSQSKIASLANSDGFRALQELIDTWIKDLENIPIDPTKDNVETVGFRCMASRVTIEYLKDLKNTPERYKELLKDEE